MADAPDKHKLFCPACRQRIAVDARDLSGRATCPRCRTSYALGELIPERTTLDAVPDGAETQAAASPPKHKLPCPKCGQRLAVETTDLTAPVHCPRCHASLPLGELISTRTTLDAVTEPATGKTAGSTAGSGKPGLEPVGPPPVPVVIAAPPLIPALPPPVGAVDRDERPTAPGRPADGAVLLDRAEADALVPGGVVSPDLLTSPGPGGASGAESVAARAAMLDSAKRGAVAAAEATGSFLRFLYRVGKVLYRIALWIDTRAHGHRATILTICITLAAFFHIGAWVSETPGVSEVSGWVVLDNTFLVLFIVLAVAFFVGRFLSWESEEDGGGRWPGWAALKDLLGRVRVVVDTVAVFFGSWFWPGKKNKNRERMEATANLLGLLGPPLYLWGRFTGSAWAVVAAVVLTASVIFRIARAVIVFFGPRLEVSVRDTGTLAPVLDCVRDADGARARARASGNEGIVELVDALCEWSPRRQGAEAGYQRSLARHLAGNVSMEVSPEHTHRTEETHCRFDLLLGDSVVIEMKTDLARSGDRDRAAGQIRRYVHAWGTKGPILLVVCETDAAFSQSLIAEDIRAMNAQGLAVFAVAAGRRV